MNRIALFVAAISLLALGGCHRDMWIQEKVKPQSQSKLYMDGLGSRIEPEGVVAFGEAKTDTEFYTGYDRAGKLIKTFPVKVDKALLKRGRERFTIFCTPCHGEMGDGNGMIAARGFKVERPIATYHTDRLREIPIGHFFDVITNGYGAMYPFGARIKESDRWAIAAYVKALQRSQNTKMEELTEDEKALMGKDPMAEKKDEAHGGGH